MIDPTRKQFADVRRRSTLPAGRVRLFFEQLEGRNLLTFLPGFESDTGSLAFDHGGHRHEVHHEPSAHSSGSKFNVVSRDGKHGFDHRDAREFYHLRNNDRGFDRPSNLENEHREIGRSQQPSHRDPTPQTSLTTLVISTALVTNLQVSWPTPLQPTLREPDTNPLRNSPQDRLLLVSSGDSLITRTQLSEPLRRSPQTGRSNTILVFFQTSTLPIEPSGPESARQTLGIAARVSGVAEVVPTTGFPTSQVETSTVDTFNVHPSAPSEADSYGGLVEFAPRNELHFATPANNAMKTRLESPTRGTDNTDIIDKLLGLELFGPESNTTAVESDGGKEEVNSNETVPPHDEEPISTDEVFAAWQASTEQGGIIEIFTQSSAHVPRLSPNCELQVTRQELSSIVLEIGPTVGEVQAFEFIDADAIPTTMPHDQSVNNADGEDSDDPLAADNQSLTRAAIIGSPFAYVLGHVCKRRQAQFPPPP